MKILLILGSAGTKSSNKKLLQAIQSEFKNQHHFTLFDQLSSFPLFTPEQLEEDLPHSIASFKKHIADADFIIISTPEYTHNIPAVLKNAIEWCTASGEFYHKNIQPITFTPNAPRGEHAMHSLLASLKALDCKIIGQLPLYKSEVHFENNMIKLNQELIELFESTFSSIAT